MNAIVTKDGDLIDGMSRQEFISSLKGLLDARDVDGVRAVCRMFGAAHPDVVARAEAAVARLGLAPADAAPAVVAPAPKAVLVAPKATRLRDGYYTVAFNGEVSPWDGHVTFRVETQEPGAKFAPGETIISRLVGPQNGTDYVGVAFLKDGSRAVMWRKHLQDKRLRAALDILLADPKAAGLGYAKASGRCYICNRMLTTPESIANGIGPTCAEKE